MMLLTCHETGSDKTAVAAESKYSTGDVITRTAIDRCRNALYAHPGLEIVYWAWLTKDFRTVFVVYSKRHPLRNTWKGKKLS